MYPIKKYTNNKATICSNKHCVTVYGETARTVQNIVVTAVALIALAAVVKALKQ